MHPIRLVVTDDLHRSRLTVFFRLLALHPPPPLARVVERRRIRHRGHQLVRNADQRPVAAGAARLPRRLPALRDPCRGISAAGRQPVPPVLRGQHHGAVPDRPRGRPARPPEPLEDGLQRLPRRARRAAVGGVPRRPDRLGGVPRLGARRHDVVPDLVLRARARPVTSRAARHDGLERRLRRAGRRLPLPAHRHLSVHGAEGASRRSRAARGLRAGARDSSTRTTTAARG